MTVANAVCPQCTVIATFIADAELVPEVETHVRVGLELLHGLDGFVSGAVHRATEDGRVVHMSRWRSSEDYSSFLHDPPFCELPSALRLNRLAETGRLRIEVQSFDVLHSTGSE